MRQQLFVIACICSAATIISAVPLPANQELDVLQIPLSDGKELDVLTLGAKSQEQLIADRNKRTVGLLRELFPDITKQVDDQVNMIITKLLRVLGPTVLRTAVQGNSANSARSSFDADFDDDDDDSSSSTSSNADSGSTTSTSSSGGTRVSIELPTFEPEDDDDNKVDSDSIKNSTTEKN